MLKRLILTMALLLVATVAPAQVVNVNLATAFFVGPNELLTAAHCLNNKSYIQFNYNGKSYTADVIDWNGHLDTAKLRVRGHLDVCPNPFTLCRSKLYIGQAFTIYGYPAHRGGKFSSDSGYIEKTFTKEWSIVRRKRWEREFVTGSAKGGPGYSGGPVVDKQTGQVIGILTNGSSFGGVAFTSFELLGSVDRWQ